MDTHFEKKYDTKYKKLDMIGYGAYTEVYRAENKITGEKRALKIVNLSKYKIDLRNSGEDETTKLEQFKQNLMREINIMKKCAEHNENSVKYYESFETEDEFAIITELCDENLNTFKEKRKFTPEDIHLILNQLNNTFKIMVKENIVHRDLKPLNILIKYDKDDKSKYTIKLCDFGISKEGKYFNLETAKENRGTIGYIAPEIMEKILALEMESRAYEINGGSKDNELIKISQNYDYKKCDLWSLGIIIYELLFGIILYNGLNEQTILNKIKTFGKVVIKKTDNKKLDDLINKLLEKDPEKRIGWNDYFNHPFFRKEITITYKSNIKKENKIKIQYISLSCPFPLPIFSNFSP